jgi:hypothetical protein
LEEEKATLEGIVKSCDELLMEIARETGLDRMERLKMMKRKKRMPTMEEMPSHPCCCTTTSCAPCYCT